MLGKPKSDSHKENMRKVNIGLKFINDGSVMKKVKPEELNSYLTQGWVLGMIK
jgi:hypothetical protein